MNEGTSQPMTAVVVNDDPTQLGVLCGLVRKAGLDPLPFAGAEEALAAMNPEVRPALIVTDLYMPVIDGWRFCRLLRSPEYAAFNEVPILVVSATFSGDHPKRIAADIGADAFLPSPVDGKEFVAQIQALLQGREARYGPRALIVEDSRTLAGVLRKAFTAQGYEADTVSTVREAEEAFGRTAYDVAVLDYHLPDGKGDALLDAFRVRRPDCVCIMMTTDPKPELALDWMKRGASAYLRKPFDPAYLIELCARTRRERNLLRVEDLLERRTRQLRESEARYRAFFEGINDAAFVHELDEEGQPGGFLDVNEAACRRLGYTPEEWLALTPRDITDPAEYERLVCKRGELKDGDKVLIETIHVTKDGRRIPVEGSISRTTYLGRPAALSVSRDITARKRAQDALRESEARVRSILEGVPVLQFVIDRDHRVIFWNRAIEEYSGISAADIIGTDNQWRAFYPEKRPVLADLLVDGKIEELNQWYGEKVRQSPFIKGAYETTDFFPLGASGVWFAFTAAPVRDAQGNIIGAVETLEDITARKQAEENLKKSEKLYRSVIENIQDVYYRSDRDGNLIMASPSGIALLGYDSVDEALGKSIADALYFDPAERAAFLAELQKTGAVSNYEIRLRKKDAALVYVSTNSHYYHDESGAVAGVEGILRDVTEQKRADEALKASEEKYHRLYSLFRLMADTMPDMLWAKNLNREFVFVNRAICKNLLNAADTKEPLGRTDMFFATREREAHPENPDWHTFGELCQDSDSITLQELKPMQFDEFGNVRGEFLHLDVHKAPLYDDAGRLIGIVGSARDVTDSRRATEEKEKLQTQLAQAQKMESVGRLAGGVAHDFNNMLGAILGYAELALNKTDPSDPLANYLQQIHKAAERSADLTRQLLAFARKQTVAPRVLDLNETMEEMLKLLRRLIGEDIELAWLPGRELWPVRMDPAQIDQVLANLCVNARDAIAGVGKVTIETDNAVFDEDYCARHPGFVPGDYVLLAVSDDGCGMDADTLSHLFEPFFTTKEPDLGTGLGLASVYGAVKQNNGFINVYSEPGRGTTFKIYLPRHAAKAAPETENLKPQAAARGTETILLVEDEPAILELTTTMLERLGYGVLAARTPGEAIRLARKHSGHIDLVMTDVVMPEMNGRDLAKNLLSIYPDIRRLFMSGYTANVIAHQGVLDEGVHFLQKPFSMNDLGAKVREALG